jgi:predicted nucleic acid-binding protein
VAIDSCIFIYELEANPRYVALARRVFAWLEKPGNTAVTSTITMTEILTLPYQGADELQADTYFGLLSTYSQLEWVPPDLQMARMAARFRASHRLRTPDAIQAATAVHSGVRGFITNDGAFRRVEQLEVMLFDELL